MSFSEERLENGVTSLQMQGGNVFSTTIVSVNGGYEQRNKNWTQARGRWQVGMRTVDELEFQDFKAFFMARGGRFQGFRLKDWTDYKDNGWGILGTGVVTDSSGGGIYQMYKRYPSGADTYLRKISKPVSGAISVLVNDIPASIGGSPGQFNIDYTTGLVTFVPVVKSITGATNAAVCKITAVNHGFLTGSQIRITSVGGMTQLNNRSFTITSTGVDTFTIATDTRVAIITGITKATNALVTTRNVHGYSPGDVMVFSSVWGMTQINGLSGTIISANANDFTVNINSTAFTTYSSGGRARKSTQDQVYGLYSTGGSATKWLQNGDTLKWEGEFDVPARFDTDEFDATVEAVVHPVPTITIDSQSYMKLGNFPVVEIRL